MSWKNLPYWLKGGVIGLSVSLVVILIFLFGGAVEFHKDRVLFYERFKLCEPCPGILNERGNIIGRDLNCVVEVCESEADKLYYKPGYANPSLSLIEFKDSLCHGPVYINGKRVDFGGEPTAFINSFCGYNKVNGFNYGKNPTFIGSFLNPTIMTDSLAILFFYIPILNLLIILFPIIGSLIGWKVGKSKVE